MDPSPEETVSYKTGWYFKHDLSLKKTLWTFTAEMIVIFSDLDAIDF